MRRRASLALPLPLCELKPGPAGATVEITAPLAAMPRLVEAPLQSLHLVARAATTETPTLAPAQWVWVRFPEPVSFEPLGDIRARALQLLVDNTYHAAGLSYDPGSPLVVETLRYNATPSVVEPQAETLYRKLATLGDVEIGAVSAFGTWLAVLKNGKLVGSHKEPPDDKPAFLEVMYRWHPARKKYRGTRKLGAPPKKPKKAKRPKSK